MPIVTERANLDDLVREITQFLAEDTSQIWFTVVAAKKVHTETPQLSVLWHHDKVMRKKGRVLSTILTGNDRRYASFHTGAKFQFEEYNDAWYGLFPREKGSNDLKFMVEEVLRKQATHPKKLTASEQALYTSVTELMRLTGNSYPSSSLYLLPSVSEKPFPSDYMEKKVATRLVGNLYNHFYYEGRLLQNADEMPKKIFKEELAKLRSRVESSETELLGYILERVDCAQLEKLKPAGNRKYLLRPEHQDLPIRFGFI